MEHALQTLLMLYLSQTSHFVCMMPESCDSVSSDLLWAAAILFQWKFQWLCMASEENHSQVNFMLLRIIQLMIKQWLHFIDKPLIKYARNNTANIVGSAIG